MQLPEIVAFILWQDAWEKDLGGKGFIVFHGFRSWSHGLIDSWPLLGQNILVGSKSLRERKRWGNESGRKARFKNKTYSQGLERFLSGSEALFPVPTWQLTRVCNFSFWVSDALLWPPWALGYVHGKCTYVGKTVIHRNKWVINLRRYVLYVSSDFLHPGLFPNSPITYEYVNGFTYQWVPLMKSVVHMISHLSKVPPAGHQHTRAFRGHFMLKYVTP